jgi:hypothetical protein
MDLVIDLYEQAITQHDISAMLSLANVYFRQNKNELGIKLYE